uniref:ABSCISIC ACID-INSENSITIVE 5-like protein 5 n=1 Tax=Aegilops tauschii TaxID=37682 RepID=M8BMD2_AEGTA
MTLEEFLVRAGVVREDMGGQTVVVPARAQALFPQGNVVAPTMQVANAVVHGVVGQGPGVPMTVAAPTTPGVLNGFGKMEGGDLSSLSPVPYPFDTVTRARKGPTVEKVVERRQRRMIKNRESAARSRQRKQVKLSFFSLSGVPIHSSYAFCLTNLKCYLNPNPGSQGVYIGIVGLLISSIYRDGREEDEKCSYSMAYIMELEAEVAKLKENNEALQKKQVYLKLLS